MAAVGGSVTTPRTIVSCPPERLSTIPRGERIRAETGMHECKMSFIVGIHQVIEILIDLHGGELALVHNVLVGEGAQIKPIMQADGMGGPLPEHVELSLEVFFIKIIRVCGLWRLARPVRRC